MPVGGRRRPAAEQRGQRLALLLIDQAAQRQGIRFVANMPIGRPSKLAEARDRARLGHAGQAEIEPVGKQTGHQHPLIGDGRAGAQMREAVVKWSSAPLLPSDR